MRPLDAGRPPRPDGGVCENGERVPDYVGPGCNDATVDCIRDCDERGGDPDCTNECFASDPECVSCYNQSILACGNELGCQREWDQFACCAERSCPDTGTGWSASSARAAASARARSRATSTV